MRLQPKKAIQADLATQRKAQIDEGVKIASKIDVLRETHAKEEGQLRQFREESVATIQADIDRYLGVKDILKDEIKILERQKDDAQIPLDIEWEVVRETSAKLVKDKLSLEQKSESLNEREAALERTEQEVENDKLRAKDLQRRASETLAKADETLTEARESAGVIRNKAQITLLSAEAKEREVMLKEKEVESREAKVAQIKKRQAQKDIEQAAHDKTIRDKYATLERTIKRTNHG